MDAAERQFGITIELEIYPCPDCQDIAQKISEITPEMQAPGHGRCSGG